MVEGEDHVAAEVAERDELTLFQPVLGVETGLLEALLAGVSGHARFVDELSGRGQEFEHPVRRGLSRRRDDALRFAFVAGHPERFFGDSLRRCARDVAREGCGRAFVRVRHPEGDFVFALFLRREGEHALGCVLLQDAVHVPCIFRPDGVAHLRPQEQRPSERYAPHQRVGQVGGGDERDADRNDVHDVHGNRFLGRAVLVGHRQPQGAVSRLGAHEDVVLFGGDRYGRVVQIPFVTGVFAVLHLRCERVFPSREHV